MLEVPISAVLGNLAFRTWSGNYRIACPLHNGTNPTAFSVYADKFFYCFACHKSGTAVDLYAALEGLTWVEALRVLRDRFPEVSGLRVAAQDLGRRVKRMQEPKLPVLELPEGLGEHPFPCRNLHFPTLKHWGVRNCVDGIFFPFRNLSGDLVGWSVRKSGNVQPKYLNSKGLRKSRILYGLHENFALICARKEVILVEGQFDALAVWDAGFPNVCSTLGSDLARDQARLLLPYVDRIKVLYDADKVGIESAYALKCKWESVFNISVLLLPQGEDPSSVSAEALEEVLSG